MRFHLFFALAFLSGTAFSENIVPGTQRLRMEGDLSVQMVAGIDRFLMRELQKASNHRAELWSRDLSSAGAYSKSIEPSRQRFKRMIGAVDSRVPFHALEFVSTTLQPARIAATDAWEVYAVRWPVFPGVYGEGLWIQQRQPPLARIIVIPDAAQTPEMLAGLQPGLAPSSQLARRFADAGCEVLIPTLVNREDTFSGNPKINRFTNQPHREWIYRQAYELGRHIIGYEVQKVLAGVDWFSAQQPATKIAVAGYGEGGLIAFYSAALDERIDITWVSGYFDAREKIWSEPIYRNVFSLLREFGDAEIATLIAPRGLIIEHSVAPQISGPPPARPGRTGAAPGQMHTPDGHSVEKEFARIKQLLAGGGDPLSARIKLVSAAEKQPLLFGSTDAFAEFWRQFVVPGGNVRTALINTNPIAVAAEIDVVARQQRQVQQLVEHTQSVFKDSERERDAFLWREARDPAKWPSASRRFQQTLWNDLIGRRSACPAIESAEPARR